MANDTKCYYCSGPIKDECFYVIKEGKLVMAHESCHTRSNVRNSGPGIIMKGVSCPGGSCKL